MKKLLYTILFLCSLSMNAQTTINVGSYNLRNKNKGDVERGNGWDRRYPYIIKLIKFHEFDIFGTQEGFKVQLEDMKNSLPGYNYIGVARDDGKEKGEHSAIFYNTNKFKLLKEGNFWLSQTPEKPSMGWDAVCYRICTWGLFKCSKSGKKFLFFNLHMDHIGTEARVQSALLIIKKIKEFGEKLPVILTGDFNVDQTSNSYKTIVTSGILNDSHDKAKFVYQNNGTWNDFKANDYSEKRIDHIFISNNISVQKWGVLTDTYKVKNPNDNNYQTRTPSDHYPIMAVISFMK